MDFVFVTYCSEKWIRPCFESLMHSDSDMAEAAIYVVDNGSADRTVLCLEQMKEKYEKYVKTFQIVKEDANLGFGKACNIGFQRGNSQIVCFFNIDTQVYKHTLARLEQSIQNADKKTVLWELRQFPYEHPKIYDVQTLETSWSSGAAFAVKREVFARIGGFDERFFMYAEDVDLSWRIRSFGYRLQYVPDSVIVHHAYQKPGEIKPVQYVHGLVNHLYLRYRFGDFKAVICGHLLFFFCLCRPEVFPGSKKMLWRAYCDHFKFIACFTDKRCCGTAKEFQPFFQKWDYEMIRQGAYYWNEFPAANPLVYIVIQVFHHENILKQTLLSLKNQTYANLKILVLDHKGNKGIKTMIRQEFKDMRIYYRTARRQRNRLKIISEWIRDKNNSYVYMTNDHFLFYADHIEVLIRSLEKSEYHAACTEGFCNKVIVKSWDPYVDAIGHYKKRNNRFHSQKCDCAMYHAKWYFEQVKNKKRNENRMQYIPKTTYIYRTIKIKVRTHIKKTGIDI